MKRGGFWITLLVAVVIIIAIAGLAFHFSSNLGLKKFVGTDKKIVPFDESFVGTDKKIVPFDESFVGTEGCSSEEECSQYCADNPIVCQEWCEENPDKCPKEHTQPTQGFPSGSFTGPGGCTGPDCETVCSTQPEVCQEWCEKNPELCEKFIGGGPAIEPPATTITFAKTVNLNAESFTEQDISKAKELGANIVTIWPGRSFKDDEYTFYLPDRLAPMINFAHKNGLQVELRSSFGGDEAENYVKYKSSAIMHVAAFSKFAEKYKVYRIVPFGEIDNNMFQHCDKITALSQELLQEMKKYYSGQIGTGVVASWRDCGFNFEGYDYLTVSVYPQKQTGMDAWLTTNPEINLISVTEWARSVADRSNIKILHIGETGVQNIGEIDNIGDFQTVEVNKEKEVEFYQKLFELVSDKVDGISIFYNSKDKFLGVNGDPAEEVVKEWYGKLN